MKAYFRTDEEPALARFCAELVRQGIAFEVRSTGQGYTVEMTGY